MRKHFNHATGNLIETQTSDGHQYDFNIKKKSGFPTRLYGNDYQSLLAEYDMKCGDKILFDMNGDLSLDDAMIPIMLEATNGEPKNKVQGIFMLFILKSFFLSFIHFICFVKLPPDSFDIFCRLWCSR